MTSDSPPAGASTSDRPEVEAWQIDLTVILLPALLVFAFCVVDPKVFADGDTSWHLATGRWILAHGTVPTTDPFSFTALGHRWVTQEWLSQVLIALAYDGGSWSGVMLLMAAAVGTAMALLAAELRRYLSATSVIVCLVLAYAMLSTHFLARPHVIALPVLIFWTVQLLKARRENRTPALWLLPLMTLWANLHGSFIFGLVFACFFALEAFLGAKGRRIDAAAKWGAFLIAATLMALITPNGVAGLTYPMQVLSLKSIQSIDEWRAAQFNTPSSLEVALFVTLFICLYRGVRIGAVRLGLLLLLLYMTMQHIRQEVVLAVTAPLLLAEPLGSALRRDGSAKPEIEWPPVRQIAIPATIAALMFIAIGVWRVATPEVSRDRIAIPVTALAHVPPSLLSKPVFNDYSFGGWLILNGVRPFMDGRSDMYGDALFNLYLRVSEANGSTVENTFRRYGIVWTILRPSSALVKRLDATPGWRRLYTDKWAVVQVREDALPALGARGAAPSV